MRTAVIGAGAAGSLAAHLLHGGGSEVHLYEIREERRKQLQSQGLRLRGALQVEERFPVHAPGEAEVPFDAVVLAVKAVDTGDALRPLSPFVHRHTFYLSLQDGFAAEELAGLVGGEKTVVAVPWLSAEEEEDGAVRVEAVRSLVLGGLQAGFDSSRLAALAEAMGGTLETVVGVAEDIRPEVWRRLRAAAGVSSLCALLGEVPDAARAREEVGRYAREAAEECERVATLQGASLQERESPWDAAVWRRLRPPMLRDVMRGAATEVGWLCGSIAEKGGREGLKTPVTSALLSLVRELEKGARSPGADNLRELRRRVDEERGMSLL